MSAPSPPLPPSHAVVCVRPRCHTTALGPTGGGFRARDFEFGGTSGLCPGSLPKEMTQSQDWADDGISLIKSNQSKSKAAQAPHRTAPHRRAGQGSTPTGQAHGSWQLAGGMGQGPGNRGQGARQGPRTLVQQPSASTDARIYFITSRSMFISLARFLLRTVLMFTT